MKMKQFLIDTFMYNDYANKMILTKIKELPDKKECVKFFSHIINSQIKWLERILQNPKVQEMSWWDPLYKLNELEEKWNESLNKWIDFIRSKTEEQMFQEVEFTGYDGARWITELKDIPLQLNFHSIHHRAQMQRIIRQQGFEPDFIDYIGMKYRRWG